LSGPNGPTASLQFTSTCWRFAADGNRVLTQRLDRFVRADGSEVAAGKVMGIFEVEGEHIVTWRDYFDVNFATRLSDRAL
jgi:limonene-1,2-epoxide hydrolase